MLNLKSVQKINITHKQGILLTLVLSFIVLNILFGKVLYHANTTYFASGGDGLRSYCAVIYQIQNDSTYLSTSAMNYPYKESVFYVDQQPLVSTFLKFISDTIVDVSNYTVGVYNLLMLFSLVLSSVVLYLLFRKLKLPVWYSCLSGIAISFLSPQIGRMGGHFALSYAFVIPVFLYLFMLFYERPNYKNSLLIGLSTFIFAATHGYYLAFSGVLVLFFWFVTIIYEKERFRKFKIYFPQIIIQLVVPFIVLSLLISAGSDAGNRPSHPWGFLFFRAYPEGVFLPFTHWYGAFFNKIMTFKHVGWEGWAYVGLVSVIATFVFIGKIFGRLITLKLSTSGNVTDKRILNIFFWSAFVLLIYSFGVPFIFDLEWLKFYIGPLGQMRALGRFAWLFFYVINIIVLYTIWNWKPKGFFLKTKPYILAATLLMISYDAWLNSTPQRHYLNNKNEALTDVENKTKINEWVKLIEKDRYQAIIPIPYFHGGSENVWLDGGGNVKEASFVVSLKTGLPVTGGAMARTSIDQTFDNLQMHYEAYRKLNVLKDMPSDKDFLVVAAKNCEIPLPQLNIIAMAKENGLIYENEHLEFYSLKFSQLEKITDGLYEKVATEIESDSLYQHRNVLTVDSVENFIYKNFYGNLSNKSYMGVDAFEGNTAIENSIFEDKIPNYDTTRQYIMSFWFGGIHRDLASRTWVTISFTDSKGDTYFWERHDLWRKMKIIDNDWLLFEFEFKLKNPADKIKISLSNPEMGNNKIYADELLIRPLTNDIYVRLPEYIGKNNRFFPIAKY